MNMDYNYNDNYRRERGEEIYDEEQQYDPEVLEQIRLARIRREKADQLARDRLHAEMVLVGAAVLIIVIIVAVIVHAGHKEEPTEPFSAEVDQQTVSQSADTKDNQGQEPQEQTSDSADENVYEGQAEGHQLVTQGGITYVDGIMIVNKTFSLPSTYDPGLDPEASEAFNRMAAQAWSEGITLWICSGYRTYSEQVELFEGYASQRGLSAADAVSARPGHSEHQSGLCMDVNTTDFSFEGTAEAVWLEEHCAEYGFIIRFPKGKESITGYEYEPWHIRYVGVEAAQEMKAQGLCLEEYLNVTSDYADSPDNEQFVQQYSQYDETSDEGYAEGYGNDVLY